MTKTGKFKHWMSRGSRDGYQRVLESVKRSPKEAKIAQRLRAEVPPHLVAWLKVNKPDKTEPKRANSPADAIGRFASSR